MRSRDLDRTVWGVRAAAANEDTQAETENYAQLRARCEKFATRMPPSAFFSHSTAALLLHAPLPFEWEHQKTVDISMAAPARAPHAGGIRGHRLRISDGTQLVENNGLRQTSAARTWFDLASILGLYDLVAVGDYLIHWRLPHTSVDEIRGMASHFIGQRGMATARMAFPLLSDRSESRPESTLRVILELDGLPRPRINHDIVFTDDGTRVRTDLAFDSFKVLLEYQGDYHRTRKDQWRKDMTRRSRLESQEWTVMELNANDLKDPAELVARIRRVLRRQGWRG